MNRVITECCRIPVSAQKIEKPHQPSGRKLLFENRRGVDVREGWHASQDWLQVHRTARHAWIERRRAAAIALLMLAVQHDMRLE